MYFDIYYMCVLMILNVFLALLGQETSTNKNTSHWLYNNTYDTRVTNKHNSEICLALIQ